MSKLFAAAIIDNAVGSAAVAAGTVFELSIPRENKFRTIWSYYDNRSFTNAGDECWINFYNNGELVAELPAAVRFYATSRIGISNYLEQTIDPAGSLTFIETNPGGPGVLWHRNQDSQGSEKALHPFKITVEADTVRMVSSRAGDTRAVLGVLSLNA